MPIPDEQSTDLFQRGCDAMLAGSFAPAIPLFEESARLCANHKTLLHLGECLVKLNRLQEAVTPLAAATTLNRQGIAPALLAEVLWKLDDPAKAKEMIDLALLRQPGYRKALALLPLIDQSLAEYNRRFDCDD